MSDIAINAVENKVAPPKALNIALWVVQALLALAFLGAASGKLLGKPEMVGLFEAIGIGQWFRFLTGALEAIGAVLILVPRTRALAAGLLSTVMLGAAAIPMTPTLRVSPCFWLA